MSYTVNPLVRVLSARPIDKKAGSIAPQKGCDSFKEMSKEEIISELNRLEIRICFLAKSLKIRKGNHARNLRYNYSKNGFCPRYLPQNLFLEWILTGRQIQQLNQSLRDPVEACK